MTTPITKERLQLIIESVDDVLSVQAGTNEDVHPESDDMIRLWDYLNDVAAPPAVVKRLAEIALAAMDAEPVSDELPLDYIQGHQDGLEWAAQMAETNHPETGDWFYDDPIELAKAIRKGPDIPEVYDNSPVIPDDWITAVNRLLDSDGSRGCYHAIEVAEARRELGQLLAAQQVGSVSN
ncbi:TPA: hypothetical protein ACWZSZ_004924 [Escherichia coli]